MSHLINQKVYDYLNKDVSRDQEMVWARHILVSTEDEAKQVIENLKSGQDWNLVAQGYSTDTASLANNGDLGWFFKGQMVEAFETAAFQLKIGEISEPVKTDYGYHVIQVLGHEVRQLTDSEYTSLKDINFRKFIDEAKAEMKITKKDIWASVVPSTPTIPNEYRIDTSASQATAIPQ
jgi:parvulin-like peptidyl-prolyl isomerase